MGYQIQALQPTDSWDNVRVTNPYEPIENSETPYLMTALGRAAKYLNAIYGKDNWYLSEGGQFVHRESKSGRMVLLKLVEIETPINDD